MMKPPAPFRDDAPFRGKSDPFVFLAGSIEMGKARDWQQEIFEALDDVEAVLLNPRRDDWDSSWEQSATNAQFRAQVEWELEGLERASVIAMYLEPSTQSPVSLLELGLHASGGKMVVCCPAGFWRKGNVDVVCQRYGVPQVSTLEDLATAVRSRLSHGVGP